MPADTLTRERFVRRLSNAELVGAEYDRCSEGAREELLAHDAAQREEIAALKTLLKDICTEWNEDCESSCDPRAHDENCKAINIAEAKKALNKEVARLTALIAEQPHDSDCGYEKTEDGGSWRSVDGCNCWKACARREEKKGRDAE